MIHNKNVYAVCRRPELAADIISGETAKTVEDYVVLNFEGASFSSFRQKSFRDGGGGGGYGLRVSLKSITGKRTRRMS